ncbi:MAG: TIGR02206 family membrane protein [Bacteroidetes bacterium]|nr:TIGR02206 family membrane protein [Bacteroidota bacterium]
MKRLKFSYIAGENMRQIHVVIAPGSELWWAMNLGFIISGVILFWMAGLNKLRDKRLFIGKALAILLITDVFIHHLYFLSLGDWHLKTNLPLHLCAMSEILSVFLLFSGSQLLYEMLIFWSAGAIHAFITPEMTHGYGVYETVSYCISHGGVILLAFYCTWALNFTPRRLSWLKVFFITQLTLPVIGFINYSTGGNYMYLSERPGANNPFIIGPWPWYIISLEFVVLLHFYLFYRMHLWLSVKKNIRQAIVE